jgi:2-polyprenyl-3-methyl-5-hydroxy-6-metoxy-1,4-benzoquinol methylase
MTSRQASLEYWNKLYAGKAYVYGTAPNEYLYRQKSLLHKGMKALAVGDGEGRNGVWLAAQGLSVVSADWSPSGVKKARRLAQQQNVAVTFACCDLLDWRWPAAEFDVVAAMYLHLLEPERKLVHHNISRSLKPGGLLILEAFHRRHATNSSGSLQTIALLYTVDLLRHDFAALQLLEIEEARVNLDEGPMHQGVTETIRVLGRKPVAPPP